MFFSVLTKKFNWEILTKNLVTFKRWDELRMKNVITLRVTKNQYIGEIT